jgi:TetR/AcrR family transcriptional regulator
MRDCKGIGRELMAGSRTALSKGEATREKILDAAEVLFANLSFAAARLEDVAQEVGIRRASIVYYFANKQELYEAMEARIFIALEARCQEALAHTTSSFERITAVTNAWLDFMVERPSAARLILRNCADVYPGGVDPVQFSLSALTIWEQALREGIESGALNPVSPVQLMQLVGGGILQYASTSQLLGPERSYEPTRPERLEEFRGLLHATIRALLLNPLPDRTK